MDVQTSMNSLDHDTGFMLKILKLAESSKRFEKSINLFKNPFLIVKYICQIHLLSLNSFAWYYQKVFIKIFLDSLYNT